MIRLLSIVLILTHVANLQAEDSWPLHIIDASSRGADGVRLGDVDEDGRLDIVTGWEEGGKIRVCLQPLTAGVRKLWPSVRVGAVKSPEDAVFADVNGDGRLDVISCCEGKQQAIFFHLNPGKDRILQAGAWKTELVKASKDASRWMFCEPLNDGTLIFGSKNPNGQISVFDSASKQFRRLRSCGWIMSLRGIDVDHDGDHDVVYSDRKGDHRSVGWLENPGDADAEWPDHLIGGKGQEVMFLDIAETNEQLRIACNTRDGHILDFTPTQDIRSPWSVTRIAHPPNSGLGKAVAFADVDQDGRVDLVCTCGLAENKFGAFWLQQPDTPATANDEEPQAWKFHDISGTKRGIKFDRIEMLDIDSDGDLDLLTCEERDNLGVIWYENPAPK